MGHFQMAKYIVGIKFYSLGWRQKQWKHGSLGYFLLISVTLRNNGKGWEDGSISQVLASQVCEPEFKSPAPHKKIRTANAICNSSHWWGGRRRIPGACYSASIGNQQALYSMRDIEPTIKMRKQLRKTHNSDLWPSYGNTYTPLYTHKRKLTACCGICTTIDKMWQCGLERWKWNCKAHL